MTPMLSSTSSWSLIHKLFRGQEKWAADPNSLRKGFLTGVKCLQSPNSPRAPRQRLTSDLEMVQGAAESGQLNHSNRFPDCLFDWTKDTAASVSFSRCLRNPRPCRMWTNEKKKEGWVTVLKSCYDKSFCMSVCGGNILTMLLNDFGGGFGCL